MTNAQKILWTIINLTIVCCVILYFVTQQKELTPEEIAARTELHTKLAEEYKVGSKLPEGWAKVTIDGHLWMTVVGYHQAAISHHPECPKCNGTPGPGESDTYKRQR